MSAEDFWQRFFEQHGQGWPPQLAERIQTALDGGADPEEAITGWGRGGNLPGAMGRPSRKLSQAQRERRKMTNVLRYSVMRRDAFRCVLCGATAETDALVVDHITPLARGGKTDPENLRVLCQRCNSGKGTRMDAE